MEYYNIIPFEDVFICSECHTKYTKYEIDTYYTKYHLNCKNCGVIFGKEKPQQDNIQLSFFDDNLLYSIKI